MKPLMQLIDYGQSYWMDDLSRDMIRDGELERRVRQEGLRGITSNPTIFRDAITKGTAYDTQIRKLADAGRSVEDIYQALVVTDVRDACDLLHPVYVESNGVDGFVSLEVSPYLAHDTQGTLDEARRLVHAVDRPNVFIKIPGTLAGVPAIEQLLYEGFNINITLLFAVDRYEAVGLAYVRSLMRRAAEKRSVSGPTSVASFFLSRIDVLVDELLGHRLGVAGLKPPPEDLLGKAAIANAKLAYQSFKQIFAGADWETLAQRGAHVQRVLWASTSTKDPKYSDVRYVEPLIGPYTVNTMPRKTISAFADHGRVGATVEQDVDDARRVLRGLAQLGINFEHVTWQLLNEGIQKFIDPFDALRDAIAEKVKVSVRA